MNQLEEHDNMIRISERLILLKTILRVVHILENKEQIVFYLDAKLKDINTGDKKCK